MARREWQGLRLVDVESDDRADDQRVSGAASEHLESFESFYLREFPRLVALARALAGDAHAHDIAQESMIVAYGKWREVAQYAAPGGWVRGVCAHKAVSSVRRSVAERRAFERLRMRRPAAATTPGEDEPFWHEVRQLPERQAQVIALFYALDLSVADVASTLGCSEGAVKSHLSRGRATLAVRLGVEKGVAP